MSTPAGSLDSAEARAQLAAERRPASLPIVTPDDRLRAAALREGFPLVEI